MNFTPLLTFFCVAAGCRLLSWFFTRNPIDLVGLGAYLLIIRWQWKKQQ